MKKIIMFIFFLAPLCCLSQTDVLILQKNGRNIKTYTPGQPIIIQTIYDQWLGGTLTDLKNDSVFVNNIPFHVHEIMAIRWESTKWNYKADGNILIIAGFGLLALNVINGLYTNESAGSWIKTSGWITAGALIVGGLLFKRAKYKDYPIGKKYGLHYLNLRAESQPANTNSSSKPTGPAKQTDAH